MRIDDSESTTNSLSSGDTEDGAGRHETSEGEKNVALCFSLSLRNSFGQLPRISAGASLLS